MNTLLSHAPPVILVVHFTREQIFAGKISWHFRDPNGRTALAGWKRLWAKYDRRARGQKSHGSSLAPFLALPTQ